MKRNNSPSVVIFSSQHKCEEFFKFFQLKYFVRENIFTPKKKGSEEKYFPFHLIFHSLNIQMEKLVELRRDRIEKENSSFEDRKVPINNISIAIVSRTIRKGIFGSLRISFFLYLERKTRTVDFYAC